MLGHEPIFDTPIGEVPDSAVVEQSYFDMLAKTNGKHTFIVIVQTMEIETAIGTEVALAIMEKAIMETDPEGVDALPTNTLILSDTPWNGKPTDTIYPNTLADTRLIKPLTMERSIPIVPTTTRRSQISFGQIEFANGDGAYDQFIKDNSVDGQRVQVYLGPQWGDFSAFKKVGDAYGNKWSAKRDKIRLTVADITGFLDVPMQEVTYTGAGAFFGDEGLSGTTKPLCFGEVFNITPTRVSAAYQVYQIHDGSVQGITSVKDQGVPLTNSLGDFADYYELATAAITPGEFATCLSLGLFRLAVAPNGKVTCDAEGDASGPGGYTNLLSQITLNLITQRTGITINDIVRSTFDGLPAGACGYFVPSGSPQTVAGALDALLGSVGAWYGGTRDRRLTVGTIDPPEDNAPQHVIGIYDAIKVDRLEIPSQPRWRQSVTYNHNWTVMADSDIATSIQGDDRAALKNTFDTFKLQAPDVAVRFTNAADGGIMTSYFRELASAEVVAREQLTLHKKSREYFSVVLPLHGYLVSVGQTVELTWGRYGLSAGKNLLVVGMREDADKGKITLRLWG
jgi:hypothetical protein